MSRLPSLRRRESWLPDFPPCPISKTCSKDSTQRGAEIGTVPGILTGLLIFGVINYGLTFIKVNPYWQLIIKGLIIVAAMAFDIRKYLAKK